MANDDYLQQSDRLASLHIITAKLNELSDAWSEAYERWSYSAGDITLERELWRLTIHYLDALGSLDDSCVPRSRIPGRGDVPRWLARTVERALDGHPPPAFMVALGTGPGPGRHHPPEVQEAISFAVEYIKLAELGVLKEEVAKAKKTVAEIYGATSKAVDGWIERYPFQGDSDELTRRPFIYLALSKLHEHAPVYRAWHKKAAAKLPKKVPATTKRRVRIGGAKALKKPGN